jgi:hypothetical protein
LNTPAYLPVLVPALGLLVPFIIRWIENRSRLRQAQHLLLVIKTRDEIEKLLLESEEQAISLPENEEEQLRYYRRELEKEIRGNDALDIRLYPMLISLEMIFFASAAFSGFLGFFRNLIYSQGNETLPFLEGIFSDPSTRIGLLLACLLGSLYLTHFSARRISMQMGINTRSELRIFLAFNGYFLLSILTLGLLLYLLDLILPWF